MPNTKTSIANMALMHLAITKLFTDVDVDAGKPAEVMLAWYQPTMDQIFRDFDWPFAVRSAALVEVAANPTTEWAYSYRYPATASRIIRIISGVWPEGPSDRIAYRILSDGTGRLIYTNKEDAELEYVVVESTVTKWTADFVTAFAALWAALAAPALTAGDQFKLGQRAFGLYQVALDNAAFNMANEEKPVPPAESEFITVRD